MQISRERSSQRRARKPTRSARRQTRVLSVERLENRCLLAGLIAHWSAENTTQDSVGDNDGALISGATYANGQIGRAFSFDGVNDRVQVPDSPSLALTGSMTIEAWILVESIPAYGGPILFRGDDRGGLDPYSLSVLNDGQLRFEVVGNNGATSMSIAAPIPVGQFTHVAATLEDNTGAMRLYLNGVLKAQATTAVRPFANLDPASNPSIGIGNHGGYPTTPHNFPFDGLIDELRVYDVALSTEEVVSHFNAERGNLAPTLTVSDLTVTEGSPAFVGVPLVPRDGFGLATARAVLVGPDGNVYVASHDTDSVKVLTEAGDYVRDLTTPSGELDGPWGMTFGADGKLYVGGRYSRNVVSFDIASGASQVLVSSGQGGLGMARGLAFGPDGDLYVSSRVEGLSHDTSSILRFDAHNGAFKGNFVAPASGQLSNANGIAFGPDGHLYVASTGSGHIKRYDGQTGEFLGNFVDQGSGGLTNPNNLLFHQDGRLYVTSQSNRSILRYDAVTGDFLDVIASGLDNPPFGVAFSSAGDLFASLGTGLSTSGSSVARIIPGMVPVVLSLSFAMDSPVSLNYSTSNGSAIAGVDYTATSGTVEFAPGETTQAVYVALVNDSDLESTEQFTVNFTLGGGIIGDPSATITVIDDESGRSISISDAIATEGDHSAHYRGAFAEQVAGSHFSMIALGPDGLIYAAPGSGPGGNYIRRYHPETGELVDAIFASGVDGIRDMVFRDGLLYVGSEYTDEVLRFNIATGQFLDVFVAAGMGGLDGPHGLTFGPDTNQDGVPELYVSGRNSWNVVRYDGATGLPLGTYVASGSGGLLWPESLTFDPSGSYLLVASTGSNQILKYHAGSGAYAGIAASTNLSGPKDVKFGADGLMYVTSGGNDRIVRFTASGVYADDYVPAASGGMDNPSRLAFSTDGNLLVTAVGNNQILRFGTESELVFTVSRSLAVADEVTLSYSTSAGTANAGVDYDSVQGTITLGPTITSKTIRVPLLDDTGYEADETLSLNLTPVSGGTLVVDSQGLGTIRDNDPPPTKFYVVNDGNPDRTYEYGAAGTTLENYSLTTGNSAPRGAVSNASGDRVWVVDANRKVFVYNISGGSLGSWTAGTLTSSAQVEGIATNGTDVWIVDNKSDRVYRYSGAATRTSGSQNSVSNFSLNSGNRNPKDLVTDGTYLYVVNDSTIDKVFKYTLTGSLVASWTISTPGAISPTGMTLDPSNPAHLWIVDNGTDRVYEYANAVSQANGSSKSADASFVLAPGNTNPQGIADPPPGTTAPDDAIVARSISQTPLASPPMAGGKSAGISLGSRAKDRGRHSEKLPSLPEPPERQRSPDPDDRAARDLVYAAWPIHRSARNDHDRLLRVRDGATSSSDLLEECRGLKQSSGN